MSLLYSISVPDKAPFLLCDARTAKRGIVIVFCPPVRLSVCNIGDFWLHNYDIGWVSSKVINKGPSLLRAPISAI